MHTRPLFAVLALYTATATASSAQATKTDSTPTVTVGAFVDGYFAWDFGRPRTLDRSFAGGTPFTTQPARHNEFNINLAFAEVKVDAPSYRGRFALQAGTSVQSNYLGEATKGVVSGPALGRTIQEAVVGTKVTEQLWIDGGIYYSHVGLESWASRDNPTYSRSLVADYSPYYQSGIKATWTPSARIVAQLNIVNGWQNISENNSGKGAGVRVDYAHSSRTSFSVYNLLSEEAGAKLRTFQGIGAKYSVGKISLLGQVDVGSQTKSTATGTTAVWYGWTAIARRQVSPSVAWVARIEGYNDPEQVIVATGSSGGGASAAPNPALRALGGSLGVDLSRAGRVLWRSELSAWRNRAALFPHADGERASATSVVAVSSLALTF